MANPTVYRATPGCERGCARCPVSCAVLMQLRHDLTRQLAAVDRELRASGMAPPPRAAMLH